jgi:putative ABC transport system permease protein
MKEEISGLFASERLNTLFLSAFAAAALLLASIGVYGTTAYGVSWRTHEIGIRMALGARARDVMRTILGEGLGLSVVGIIIGLGGALLVTRVISSLLYDVSPTDPWTFACVALLLAGVALVASYVPARRAARVDPMSALRYE